MAKSASLVIGWREWIRLPDLGIRSVKAKVDTGARSSSLHAFDIKIFERVGRTFVTFKVHPLQRNAKKTVECESEVLDFRQIRSSTGHAQERPVIRATISVLGDEWPIDLTLANRDEMGFRMLLGREAVRGRFLVDAGKSFYAGRPKKKQAVKTRAAAKKAKTTKRSKK